MMDKINRMIHPVMRRYLMHAYNKKMAWCKRRHPELFKPVSKDVKDMHLALWGKLGYRCSDKWLRFLSNITGIADYRYCPEDLLYGCIERVLNDCERGGREAEDKNQFDLYVEQEDQARTLLRYIRGSFYDESHNFVPEERASDILQKDHGPLIGKQCVNSLGGHGICAFSFENGIYRSDKGVPLDVEWIKRNSMSWILQERICQCDFSAQFNPSSANSCKLITLRCPWDGVIDVVAAGMRFGVTTDVFDNLSSGGISVAMDPKTGALWRNAYNWYKADPFPAHPSTGVKFHGLVHPYFRAMRSKAIYYASKVHNMNMLSWDTITDKEGRVKVLEVNATSQSSDWLQFGFGGLFGEYTEKVVEWCATHKDFDRFEHIRTWY